MVRKLIALRIARLEACGLGERLGPEELLLGGGVAELMEASQPVLRREDQRVVGQASGSMVSGITSRAPLTGQT